MASSDELDVYLEKHKLITSREELDHFSKAIVDEKTLQVISGKLTSWEEFAREVLSSEDLEAITEDQKDTGAKRYTRQDAYC